ncbi:MAG: ATP-binding cassette domain-containing protein [Tannerellaceae bacterium]|jgi:ATPase subunit of ABC transporter with duplicated ATPase domains|nr:ATP-binding cassette domain-containing protein [Tannerellaceae bacterium]
MITLKNIEYIHPNGNLLFSGASLALLHRDKAALIGNNGSGKSTLLQIIAGRLPASSGSLSVAARPFYAPQLAGQTTFTTIAAALQVERKFQALREILAGNTSADNFAALDDDWNLEERCMEALSEWGVYPTSISSRFENLSGGEKMKIILAGIKIHNPAIALLDEPTNHLDAAGRNLLYERIEASRATMIIVSHDRALLEMLSPVCELGPKGIDIYGGNYTFFREQKEAKNNAFADELHDKEKALRKARATEREVSERRQRQSSRQKDTGMPTILVGRRKAAAENTTAKLKDAHAAKINALTHEVGALRKDSPSCEVMKFGFSPPAINRGKTLICASGVWLRGPNGSSLPNAPADFSISAGERVRIVGANGSGKTTFIRILLGELEPGGGSVTRTGGIVYAYVDQNYSLVDAGRGIYAQAQLFNDSALPEHEVKTRLNRFLFSPGSWQQPCALLSGGEKMRLTLCCLTLRSSSPDLLILDEPANNLDIRSMDMFAAAVNEYEGALIIVSHDLCFVERVKGAREFSIGKQD